MITFKSEGYVRLTFPETSSCGGNWLMVHWLSVEPRISFSNLSGHLSFSNHSILIHFTATFDIFCCFLLFTIALKSKTVLTGRLGASRVRNDSWYTLSYIYDPKLNEIKEDNVNCYKIEIHGKLGKVILRGKAKYRPPLPTILCYRRLDQSLNHSLTEGFQNMHPDLMLSCKIC